jgi:hypothetical protein
MAGLTGNEPVRSCSAVSFWITGILSKVELLSCDADEINTLAHQASTPRNEHGQQMHVPLFEWSQTINQLGLWKW